MLVWPLGVAAQVLGGLRLWYNDGAPINALVQPITFGLAVIAMQCVTPLDILTKAAGRR